MIIRQKPVFSPWAENGFLKSYRRTWITLQQVGCLQCDKRCRLDPGFPSTRRLGCQEDGKVLRCRERSSGLGFMAAILKQTDSDSNHVHHGDIDGKERC